MYNGLYMYMYDVYICNLMVHSTMNYIKCAPDVHVPLYAHLYNFGWWLSLKL